MWNKEKTIVAVVAAAVIVFAVVFSLMSYHGKSGQPANGGSGAIPSASGVSAVPTKAPAPDNVTVPNEGDVVVSQDIAVPEVQASAHPTGSGSYRQFALNMDGDAFTPNTVAVHKGDIVDLEVTATDKNYDFTQPDYGFNTIAIAQGATQKVQFQAVNTGKFTFYCSSCGGPAKGPVGYMIVTAD